MEKYKIVFFSAIVVVLAIIILHDFEVKPNIQLYLDKSGPFIGSVYTEKLGFDGNGIKIAIVDTGVDYNHPDLSGFGPNGKVIGGYDYVDNDNDPMDTSGHGTEVAGIIAADGSLKGIAPKSKILAYRVSSDGESVSSDFIIKAIHHAIKDEADVINISLGVNKTNLKIDNAVNDAIKKGIVVVTAAGNNGPGLGSIGSPGRAINSITVGASFNNNTSSLVSTLDVRDKQYQVFPMIGTSLLSGPISAQIIFGEYGKIEDLQELDVQDSILLVERGSDKPGEIVYFSEKEFTAAQNGAEALIVYNNQPGIFFGELIHEEAGPDYVPSIPAVSMSREEGLELRETLESKTLGILDVFYHADFVAPFSSRGPVSPFYIKPDLVAPGAFVNTTLSGGKYNLTSGTSFAAPHVSGAVAILLQKDPTLKPIEIASILSTTADPVSDPYGNVLSSEIAGNGRLNLTKAFDASLIIVPDTLIFNLSPKNPTQIKPLHLKDLNGVIPPFDIEFEWGENEVDFVYSFENEQLNIESTLVREKLGDFEGTLIINDKKTSYRIPILIHITEGTVDVTETNGKLIFDLAHPKDWSYAKISVTNKNSGQTYITSVTPIKTLPLAIYESGEYWIETQITTADGIETVYETIIVSNPSHRTGFEFFDSIGITSKPFVLILIITGLVIVVGMNLRRK
ncbi:MAG: S8 family serine peptidase [Nitrosopumilaceae archaeon]